MIQALEMRPFGILERRAALSFHQPRGWVGKVAFGIAKRCDALGLEEERPARPEALQHIVRARAGSDEFGFGRAVEIGAAKGDAALEASVLVEDDAGRDEGGARQRRRLAPSRDHRAQEACDDRQREAVGEQADVDHRGVRGQRAQRVQHPGRG